MASFAASILAASTRDKANPSFCASIVSASQSLGAVLHDINEINAALAKDTIGEVGPHSGVLNLVQGIGI